MVINQILLYSKAIFACKMKREIDLDNYYVSLLNLTKYGETISIYCIQSNSSYSNPITTKSKQFVVSSYYLHSSYSISFSNNKKDDSI